MKVSLYVTNFSINMCFNVIGCKLSDVQGYLDDVLDPFNSHIDPNKNVMVATDMLTILNNR